MRIKNQIEDISYAQTKRFFEKRAEKYDSENPNAVTMFQDGHPELVKQRNAVEAQKLLPLLRIEKTSRVLDLACGIGKWADIIGDNFSEYCGIDFSQKLISIAKANFNAPRISFIAGDITVMSELLRENNKGKYDRILFFGAVMYINDSDLYKICDEMIRCSEEHTIICIKASIGKSERLTLKDFFSEELHDNYNAIYRTDEEMRSIFEQTFFRNGFELKDSGPMYENSELNNREETIQYYYLLER